MRILGNVLWFLLCGLWVGVLWAVAGLLWCVTIIGIPVGVQCFKLAGLAFWPFGKTVVNEGGGVSVIANVIWVVTCGIPIAVVCAVIGVVFCITIIGIPFGKQCFKLAQLALTPFGARVLDAPG